ncbi:zona pellucida sperm-binding protein 3-like [Genypterus blacodes]|uniref:zona pellucida sperm-binding protein 3-like n=1 Tax=Genypterus blacodes TaxID=154954 RepID=UPI003F776D0F
MEASFRIVHLLLRLFLSGICIRSCFAFPPKHVTQDALFDRIEITGSQSSTDLQQEQQHTAVDERQQVNTVGVICHPDSVEVVIEADLFGIGAPVNPQELRLGVEYSDFCRAAASSEDVFRIIAGLQDCGTKHWMTDGSLIYTNLLIYSPGDSPDGVIRMDEAVIPIECHYQRKYSLSSSTLVPTWMPFTSTQAAVETLEFGLRIMTNDWLYERSSNVFYLGEPISIEASVRVGHHMGLRVFLSSCVATLEPDIHSTPRYVFIEDGCLVDSQLPGSHAQFKPRTQDNKLHLVIDAFRFHGEDRGELYITCHMNAVPVNDAEAPNKACTFVNGRWRSADGNDYLCSYCQSETGQSQGKHSSPGMVEPRSKKVGLVAENSWRSGLTPRIWEHEQKVGPMLILPARQRSEPIPEEELPPLLSKISRPALYGSKWRGGMNFNMGKG